MAHIGKELIVKGLREKFLKCNSAVYADYRGLTVSEMTDLRTKLRAEFVELHVAKNTLTRIAAKGTPFESSTKDLSGPTTIAFGFKDISAPARVMMKFSKTEPKLIVKGGSVEGQNLSSKEVKVLADLPSKEVLLSILLATMNGPITNFAGVLQGVLRKFLYALKEIEAKKK